jgi:hypothetical protein
MYADKEYYAKIYGGSMIPEDEIERALDIASMHIDSLTYNRIVGRGFSGLTEFQQNMVRRVCCMQAEFEYENAALIQSVLDSYSLNGVSMSFGSNWKVTTAAGVAMRRDVYAMLCQTGLCDRRCI